MGVAREFENLHALVHVGLFGDLMPVDLALQAVLLLAPFAGEAVVEVAADLAVCSPSGLIGQIEVFA
ncbi:MAG: hypothetical protein FJX55_21105 [Alphaproteobacteria bacterium]|nr:hypothetical protein [Alphaproteobacteria bacterium]